MAIDICGYIYTHTKNMYIYHKKNEFSHHRGVYRPERFNGGALKEVHAFEQELPPPGAAILHGDPA